MSMTQSFLEQAERLPVLLHPGDCDGKTYIVTGSNTGIGFETAKHLVRCSASRVILAVRNVKAGEKAKRDIVTATGRTGDVDVWQLDLASFASVKAFVAKANTELTRIDCLVENAGVALDKWTVSEGMETSVTVNVTSTILLGAMLMPKLIESAKKYNIWPRLVIVGANLGFAVKSELDKFKDGSVFSGLNDPKRANMDDRYAVTKLVQTFAVRQFAVAFPVDQTRVVINLVSPGLCKTDLARDYRSWSKFVLTTVRAVAARTPEEGSRTILHAIAAESDSHGKLLSGCKVKEHWVPQWVTNEDGQRMQKKIWAELRVMLEEIQPGCTNFTDGYPLETAGEDYASKP
ncbi:hypothetical protein BX600DRAFT_497613 [Xylariales sp. PMI_506]|nr:hypothetical protein BX600DRAFT_497613 [Xylariales sp. PMI_506]